MAPRRGLEACPVGVRSLQWAEIVACSRFVTSQSASAAPGRLSTSACRSAPGEIVALLGENGAGKSTLIKILAGVYRARRRGRSLVAARDVTHARAAPADRLHPPGPRPHRLDDGRREHLPDARLPAPRRPDRLGATRDGAPPRARKRRRRHRSRTCASRSLTRTEKSLVAIARALAAEAELLVLDEPTASLPADEVARLFAALRRLRARGVGMIYVSHRLDEVFEIADRDGRAARRQASPASARSRETTPEETDPADRRPRAVAGLPPAGAARRRRRALALDGLALDDVGPVDCDIHAGEIVGLVGLRGAGQEVHRPRAVRLRRRHRRHASCSTANRLRLASPREAMAAGINLVCADRVGGIGRAEPIGPREPLPQPGGGGHGACLLPRAGARERSGAASSAERVGLRPNDPDARRSSCSRAATSRRSSSAAGCISTRKVYVFEDPTAGVDVGAKAEIYRLFDVALQARRGDHRSSRPTSRRSPRSATARWCSTAAGSSRELAAADLSVENLLAAASAARAAEDGARPDRRQARTPMQSIKSNALEPTRAGARRPDAAGRRSCACCRSTACRS